LIKLWTAIKSGHAHLSGLRDHTPCERSTVAAEAEDKSIALSVLVDAEEGGEDVAEEGAGAAAAEQAAAAGQADYSRLHDSAPCYQQMPAGWLAAL
jgi:hypothetical protein